MRAPVFTTVFTTSGERDLSKGVEKLPANGLECVGFENQVLLCEQLAVLQRKNSGKSTP